ncbi:hypothetical protein TPL01_10410 [Sulfuriferula plumbiphila]|uniref:Uncharacterized protein n=1 Tax=Sulfuriferula plumbiphila TaxID=171865 RepID=A0A512L5Z9_9PROT|nr:hypothetical protein [Sulfuriferula plumbiphila]BBP05160.1 hypothetical protein SFPGR_25820 [Sulfuriferula plumbiphila]GEP29903.1 hypothetical protein TPL01_10410 [Sulfuriferula plumbiphila]
MLPSPFATWIKAVDLGFNSAHIITYCNFGENLQPHHFRRVTAHRRDDFADGAYRLYINERLSATQHRKTLAKGVCLPKVRVEEAKHQCDISRPIIRQGVPGGIHD